MALKQFNPTSPGRRFMTTLDFSDLTKLQASDSLISHSRTHAAVGRR